MTLMLMMFTQCVRFDVQFNLKEEESIPVAVVMLANSALGSAHQSATGLERWSTSERCRC